MSRRVYLNPDLCTGCTLCMAACSVARLGVVSPARSGIQIRQDLEERWEIQLICRHCDDPHCVDACIAGLIKKDPASGLVTNDPEHCVGCWSCVMACPFGSIARAPAAEGGREVALKCDGCVDREEPACVYVCPTGALAVGEEETEEGAALGPAEEGSGVSGEQERE